MASLPTRLVRNIMDLRDEFKAEVRANVLPTLRYVVIAFEDSLSAEAVFGATGLIRERNGDWWIPAPPGLTGGQVITFEGLSVLTPPLWTQEGAQLRLDPMTFNMLPEARERLIAKPGWILTGHLVVDRMSEGVQCRRTRLQSLSEDVARCLARLQMLVDLEVLRDPNVRFRAEPMSTWLRLVHKIAWLEDKSPDSLLCAVRNTWLVKDGKRVTFLPYEERSLRELLDMPMLAEMRDQIEVPPKRFVSYLQQDVFAASAHALDDLLELTREASIDDINQKHLAAREASASAMPRDQIFVSYAREDEEWCEQICRMLQPAVQYGLARVWYDRKIKPGQKWRAEIEQALGSARVGVLLVSANFFSSEFIGGQELPYLLEAAEQRAVKLLWVSVGHCMYEVSPLADIQCVNDPNQPLNSLQGAEKEREIKTICKALLEAYKTD